MARWGGAKLKISDDELSCLCALVARPGFLTSPGGLSLLLSRAKANGSLSAEASPCTHLRVPLPCAPSGACYTKALCLTELLSLGACRSRDCGPLCTWHRVHWICRHQILFVSSPSSSNRHFRLFQQHWLLCTSYFWAPAKPGCLCPFLGLAVTAVKPGKWMVWVFPFFLANFPVITK